MIWLVSLLLAIPPIFGWGRYILEPDGIFPCFDYFSKSLNNITYILYLFTGGYIIPLCVISSCYIQMILILQKTRDNPHCRRHTHQKCVRVRLNLNRKKNFHRKKILTDMWNYGKMEMQVTKTAFVLITVFLICWTPYALLALIEQFATELHVPMLVTISCIILAKASVLFHPLSYKLLDMSRSRKKTHSNTPPHLDLGNTVSWVTVEKSLGST